MGWVESIDLAAKLVWTSHAMSHLSKVSKEFDLVSGHPVNFPAHSFSISQDTLSELPPHSLIRRSSWEPWKGNSWIPLQRRTAREWWPQGRESGALTLVLYAQSAVLCSCLGQDFGLLCCPTAEWRPSDVRRGDGFVPALNHIPAHIAGRNRIFVGSFGGSDICKHKSAGPKRGVVWEIGCRRVI